MSSIKTYYKHICGKLHNKVVSDWDSALSRAIQFLKLVEVEFDANSKI